MRCHGCGGHGLHRSLVLEAAPRPHLSLHHVGHCPRGEHRILQHGLGFTPINVEYHRSSHLVAGNAREIFYVCYIDWFITTPLLLLDLLLTAGMPWPTILRVILVDLVMIVCGLVGALVQSTYKWRYFAFGR